MKFVIVFLIIQNSFFAQDSLIDKKDTRLDTSKIPKFDFKPKLDFFFITSLRNIQTV